MPAWTLYEWEQTCSRFIENCDAGLRLKIQCRLAILIEQGDRARYPISVSYQSEKGLFEFRASYNNRHGRFLYCFLPGRKVVFLAASYKTDKLSESVVKIAVDRMKSLKSGRSNVIPFKG